MGGYIKVNAKRVETTALNTKINKEVLDNFKIYCKELGYPLNVLLETFMRQYTNGKFKIEHDEILKWKKDDAEKDTLNTTFNKEIYTGFKAICKDNGYFVKHVVTAFMDEFSNRELVMEFTKLKE